MTEVICDYCKNPAQLVNGKQIYPHLPHLWEKMFWHCDPCKAYVGCHKNSQDHKPLGSLANAELRYWKRKAHASFDPIWQNGEIKRREAYKLLAQKMEIKFKDCHIGMFDIEQCREVVKIASSWGEK